MYFGKYRSLIQWTCWTEASFQRLAFSSQWFLLHEFKVNQILQRTYPEQGVKPFWQDHTYNSA